MAIVLSLLAAAFYGTGDFCGGLATRRSAVTAVMLGSQTVGLAGVALALLVVPGAPDPGSLALGAVAGLVGAVGLVLFYRALAVGTMSVVAPITAVTAVAVPVVVGLIGGERPHPLALVGVVVGVAAVVLVSAEGGRLPRPGELLLSRSAGVALLAGAFFGVLFVLLARTAPTSGLWPLVGARAASLSAVLIAALLLQRPVRPTRSALPLVIGAGVGDMGANALFIVAQRLDLLVITSVLTSLYPAVTVLLARLVLHERLAALQRAGLAVAAAAVVLIALAQSLPH